MTERQRTVRDSHVQKTELVLPTHTNALGSAFGGVIMSWIDVSAAIAAQRHSQSQVVTASIDALHFVAPVKEGWVINIQASVNRAFKTSMEVGVRVDAENPITRQYFHTATAYLTFVALDDSSKPIKVPIIIPESEEEKRRYEEAEIRREMRLKAKESLAKQQRL